MSAIGKNVKALREGRNYTQAELATLAGVDEKYISAIERGVRNPGKKLMVKLCDALAVDEQTVRFGERKEEKPPVPEHLRLLHAEIDRVAMNGRTPAEQYELTAKILRILQEEMQGQTR